MRRWWTVLLRGGIGVILASSVAFGAVIHVPADQPTIQAAINAAVNGDTVLVAPGTYAEHLSITNKAIFLLSSSGARETTIHPQVSGLALLTCTGPSDTGRVSGFTFAGVSGYIPGWSAVVLMENSRSILNANVLTDNSTEFCVALISGGVPTFEGNLIWDNDCYGGMIFSEAQARIRSNTICMNNGRAIYLSSGSADLRNNILAFNSGDGVYRYSGSHVLRHNDIFANAPNYYGIVPDPTDISADPFFCDDAAGDFTLASNSPCVGAGEGGIDIGAFGVGCTNPAPAQPQVQGIGIDLPGDSLHVTSHAPVLSWAYFDQQSRPHTKSEVEVGTDNNWVIAEMWQPPTIISSDTSVQYAGLTLLDGMTYYVRIRVFNDTLWSNWRVAPFRMNSVPTAPAPLFPNNGGVALTGRPNLVVMNATDAEGDSRRYDFEVFRDSALTQLTSYFAGKVEGFGQTTWKTDSLTAENQRHWWRARATDGYESGPWSAVWSFVVDGYNQPPQSVSLFEPADSGSVTDLTPQFVWSHALDPDPDATATYTLILALDRNFTFKAEVSGLPDSTLTWPDPLAIETPYWWKVKAEDGRGGSSMSSVRTFTTHPPCDCPCHGDPQCDGVANVQDVVQTVNVAFRGAAPVFDPNCPRERTDVNCDGFSTVQDVVKVVNVAFRSANPASEFREPCGM